MRNARLVVRVLVLGLVTLVLWLVLVIVWPFAALAGVGAEWRVRMTGVWSTCLAWILSMRIEVEGTAPPRGVLLVSNHLSYIDIVLLSSRVRCSFVSKSDVADWPLIGHLARLVGTLFIDRNRRRDVVRVAGEIRARLARGRTVVVFPEGTSTNGVNVAPFRSSLLEPAIASALPVYYATIRYSVPAGEAAATDSVAWWGDMSFAPHLAHLMRMSGFTARVVFGAEPIEETDRKSLARRLHSAVASRFIPMLPDEDACLTSRTFPASS